MRASPGKPERWNLTPLAFEAMLTALGPERSAAAARYELLRRRLIKYFEWERCTFPEDRVDEVLNRFARRLAEGEPVANAQNYCYGIARLVAREAHLEAARQQEASAQLRAFPPHSATEPGEIDRCFDRCLGTLEPSHRILLLAYYEGEKSQRIQNRLRLSVQLAISPNSLRNRALRLREKIENCTRRCLEAGSAPGALRDRTPPAHTDD